MKPPGPIALRAMQEAQANEGVTEENGSNWGTYVKIYLAAVGLFSPAPWCQAFVVFRLLDAAADLKLQVPQNMPRTAYTPDFANWAKEEGLWLPNRDELHGQVRPGDLCYFYFKTLGRVGHVGFVTGVYHWGVTTVEGNTGRAPGVNRDGGGVWKRNRTWESFGSKGGFVRLPF